MKSTIKEILETVLMALAIFIVLQTSVMGFIVDGSSMEPNLHTGQRLLVNKAVYFRTASPVIQRLAPGSKQEGEVSYLFHPPQRGEVVLFYFPRDTRQIYIKRVIGLPGETVEIRDGKVYINSRLIREPGTIPQARAPFGPLTIPANQYFVLGDNRNGSSDSRSGWTVPYSNIIGKAWLVYGRPWEWGVAPNYDLAFAQASSR